MPGIWGRLSPADMTTPKHELFFLYYRHAVWIGLRNFLQGWLICMWVLLTRWDAQSGNPDLKPLLITKMLRFLGDSLWKLQSLRVQFSYKVKDVMILPQLSHSVCPHPLVNLFSTTATHQNHTAIFITMCACVPRTHSERNTKDHNLWLACRLLRQVAQFVTYTYTLPKDTFILFKEWNKVKFWDLKKYGYKKQPFK